MKEITQSVTVGLEELADKVGSGSLPIYSTPSMIAFMENTAIKLLDFIPEGKTSLGVEINARHLRASKPGEELTCTARLVSEEDGRFYNFEIEVHNSQGDLIGKADHKRAVVDSAFIMAKLEE